MREYIIFTMKERGLTQVALAKKLGITKQYLNAYLRGRNNSVRLELRILEVLYGYS